MECNVIVYYISIISMYVGISFIYVYCLYFYEQRNIS
nr:MAG TPA: hypothetical protein [Caudoviricetes sp.]